MNFALLANRAFRVLATGALLTLPGCQAIMRSAISSEVTATLKEIQSPEWMGSQVKGDVELVKLADDLYAYRWAGYRTVFLTTSEGVILFDPINPVAAPGIAKAIASVAPNPQIRYVIYSHHHADHASGASLLPGHPTILAHANAARDIKAWTHDGVATPTEVWEGNEHEVSLGEKSVKLFLLPISHTDGNVVMLIPHRRALYIVDVFPGKKSVTLLGAPFHSYHGDLRALAKVQSLDYDLVIPGHGKIGTKEDVTNYVTFLHDAKAQIAKSVKKLGLGEVFAEVQNPKVGALLFDAYDALQPKYGNWSGYEHHMLSALQWVLVFDSVLSE